MGHRILQLSDLHLTPAAKRAWGTDVWAGFERTLAALPTFEPFSRLVLSGDLANRPSAAAYAALRRGLEPYWDRTSWVPGNHDGRRLLSAAFGGQGLDEPCRFVTHIGDWRLIGLDSKRAWRVHGRLGTQQLRWLATQLREPAPTLLFLHHPVAPVGTWWLDRDVIRDAAALRAAVDGTGVRGIFCGHVHQEFSSSLGASPFFACPSTAYQFRPGSRRPGAVESRTSALRVIELGDGDLVTRVERL